MLFLKSKPKKTVQELLTPPQHHFEPSLSYSEFSHKMLKQALFRIINDAVLPLELVNESDRFLNEIGAPYLQFQNELSRNVIFKESQTLRELVVESLYLPVTIFKVNIAGDHYFFKNQTPMEKDPTKILLGDKEIPILGAFSIDKPLIEKDLLLAPFKLLYNFYLQIDLCYQKGQTVFFKKHNFNATLDAIKDPQRYEDMIDAAKKTYTDFFNGKGGVIDEKDSFEIPSVSVKGISEAISFVYSELSRMLGVPKSELLGESPTGLNSGGILEFQKLGYERRLSDYRKRLIEPILKTLGVEYRVSGLSLTEKLALLKDFSSYAKTLESLNPDLYLKALELTYQLLGEAL